MSNPVLRARALFPTIQITMVSIIVAFTLQEWLERLPQVDEMWEPTLLAARIWCQALTAFVIIVKMWSGFVLAAVVRERVPTAIDLLGPIGILIFVDAQIASIGVEHVLRWWYVLGAGSLVAAAFIAGQRLNLDPAEPMRSGSALRRPATVETLLGAAALAIAFMHQTIEFSEVGLLVAGALFLIAESLTAIGPILGWRALRAMELQRSE